MVTGLAEICNEHQRALRRLGWRGQMCGRQDGGSWPVTELATETLLRPGDCREAAPTAFSGTPKGLFSAEPVDVLGLQLASATIVSLDRLIDFLAMDGDLGRCIDTESNFVTTDVHHGDHDIIADHDAFVTLSRQYQHPDSLSLSAFLEKCRRCQNVMDGPVAGLNDLTSESAPHVD